MNNLDKLWAYIKEKAPPGGIPGDDGRQYRDLKQYYESKAEQSKQEAPELINGPLEVCGLTPEGRELSQPGKSKELAVAAHLLAVSIIKNCDPLTLQKHKKLLDSYGTVPLGTLNEALKIMLTKGDLVESKRFPKSLELKNFGSVTYKKWGQEEFIAMAENAYGRALDLLRTMNQKWSASSTGIPEQFKQAFRTYFGDPGAKVDAEKLGFYPHSPVRIAMFYRSLGSLSPFFSSQPRWAVVRAVLDSVWQGLQTKPVRLYFGGRAFIPGDQAYTRPFSFRVRHPERINVHLAWYFFTERGEQAIKGTQVSRAGVLIHEFTHALADTVDAERASEAFECKALAEKESALTNAQNYALFVEDALG